MRVFFVAKNFLRLSEEVPQHNHHRPPKPQMAQAIFIKLDVHPWLASCLGDKYIQITTLLAAQTSPARVSCHRTHDNTAG
jgi:hypothetical protein